MQRQIKTIQKSNGGHVRSDTQLLSAATDTKGDGVHSNDDTQSAIDAPPSLRSVTIAAMSQDSDPQKAADIAAEMILTDDAWDDLHHQLIRKACLEDIYDARHRQATGIKRNPNPCARDITAIIAAGRQDQLTVLDWPMPDGRRLAEYIGSELIPLAAENREHARGYAQRAAFFEWLALTAGDSVIGEVVKVKDAAEKWKEIEGGQSRVETQSAVAARKTSKKPPRRE